MTNNFTVTTVILIRHGERDDPNPAHPNPNPHLNGAGKARAQTLVHVLGRSGIKAIYTSHFIRTQETARPLALHLGLLPTEIDEAQDIKNDLLSKHVGEPVLVVGHTDTVPDLIKQLGGGNVEILDQEFDNLYVVAFFNPGQASLAKLKYGHPS
jgi:phosphohistidine phosphatase SixA